MNGKTSSKNAHFSKERLSKLKTKSSWTKKKSLPNWKVLNIKNGAVERKGRRWQSDARKIADDYDSFFLHPHRCPYFNNNANFAGARSIPAINVEYASDDDANESSMGRGKKKSASFSKLKKLKKLFPSRRKKSKNPNFEITTESDSEINSRSVLEQDSQYLTSTPYGTGQNRAVLSPVKTRRTKMTPERPENFDSPFMTEEDRRQQKSEYAKDLMNHYFGLRQVHGSDSDSSSSSSEDKTVVSKISSRSKSSSSPSSEFNTSSFSMSRSRLTKGLRRMLRLGRNLSDI